VRGKKKKEVFHSPESVQIGAFAQNPIIVHGFHFNGSSPTEIQSHPESPSMLDSPYEAEETQLSSFPISQEFGILLQDGQGSALNKTIIVESKDEDLEPFYELIAYQESTYPSQNFDKLIQLAEAYVHNPEQMEFDNNTAEEYLQSLRASEDDRIEQAVMRSVHDQNILKNQMKLLQRKMTLFQDQMASLQIQMGNVIKEQNDLLDMTLNHNSVLWELQDLLRNNTKRLSRLFVL